MSHTSPKISRNLGRLARWLPTLLALAALLTIGGLQSPGFLSPGNLCDLLDNKAELGLVAIGAFYVILGGGIDLSVGSLLALASVAIASLLGSELPFYAVVPIVLLGCFALGYVQGAFVGDLGLPAFLVTLAGMFLYRGLALLWTREALPIGDELVQSLAAWRLSFGEVQIGLPALLWISWLLLSVYLLSWHPFGRALYAVGGDERAAYNAAVPVARVKRLSHALAGLSVGLAAIARVFYVPSGDPGTAVGLELEAIAAVVIGGAWLTGGVGHAFGSALGVLVLGLIEMLIAWDGSFSAGLMRVAIAALLLGFVLLQRLQRKARVT